jgi:hypothetical protein
MFAGVKPCLSTSRFTTRAPVPQSTPAPQAAANARPVDEDFAAEADAGVTTVHDP